MRSPCSRRCCASCTRRIPEIVIELDTSQRFGISARAKRTYRCEAPRRTTQPAGLVGRQLCIDDWALYCSRDYAARHGVPRTRAQLKKHAFIGGGGGNLWIHYQDWLQSLGLEEPGRDASRDVRRPAVRASAPASGSPSFPASSPTPTRTSFAACRRAKRSRPNPVAVHA